jgi:peptidoglycan/LPS O-acetylase OafA/YrhL
MMLQNYLRGRDNNFNLIRLIAATLVIFSHSYVLAGRVGQEPLAELFGMDSSHVAVHIFFVISGFLLTASLSERKNLLIYAEGRFLRIFPGLCVAVLFSALVIGGLFTTLARSDYFARREVWEFIGINSALILDKVQLRYTLPGVFPNNPNVNGSLWTLPYEVWLYIAFGALGWIGILNKRAIMNGFLLTVLTLFVFSRLSGLAAEFQTVHNFGRFSLYFFAGVAMYVNRDFVPLKLLPVILLWLGMWLARGTALHGIITFLALVYSVFWFAYVPAGWIRNYNQLGDYSFGTYIYAFPIQQSIIFVFGAIEPLALCALAIACTLPFAIVSWHLIEKNALGLKGSLSRWVHSHAPVG